MRTPISVGMSQGLRAILRYCVVLCVTALMLVGTANATKRLGCETSGDPYLSQVEKGMHAHHAMADVSATDDCSTHEANHCMGAACSMDLCELPRIDAASRLFRNLELRSDGAPLLTFPAPEGLHRPPQA